MSRLYNRTGYTKLDKRHHNFINKLHPHVLFLGVKKELYFLIFPAILCDGKSAIATAPALQMKKFHFTSANFFPLINRVFNDVKAAASLYSKYVFNLPDTALSLVALT